MPPPTAIANYQLPGSLFLASSAQVAVPTATCTVPGPSPVVHDTRADSFLFFSFLVSHFPDASVCCTLHPSTQDQTRPTHPWNSCTYACHGKYPWQVTKYLKSQPSNQKPDARSHKPGRCHALSHSHAYTPPRGHWAGPPSLPLPLQTPQPAWVPVLRLGALSSGRTSSKARRLPQESGACNSALEIGLF